MEDKMADIESNTFAEACFNMNTIAELEQALRDGPDATDMANWNITADEWKQQIELALSELKAKPTH
jgi:hypothetical protein